MKALLKSFLIFAAVLAANIPIDAQHRSKKEEPEILQQRRDRQKSVYMFGVASNFKDSVTYLTSVQRLEGAVVQQGTGFLMGRSLYSTQLKSYIEGREGKLHEVPMLFYDTDRKKILKKYRKVQKNLLSQKDIFLRMVDAEDFRFGTVTRDVIIEQGHIMGVPYEFQQETPQGSPQGSPQEPPQGPPPSLYEQP